MDIHKFGKVPSLPHVCTKRIYGKLGAHRLQEKIMIYLTPERRLRFLFDQEESSLHDSELSEEVLLEEVLSKSLFPNASMDSQLVRQPPLHSHSIASSPARAYKPECYGGWQLSGPLQARTCARKNVR